MPNTEFARDKFCKFRFGELVAVDTDGAVPAQKVATGAVKASVKNDVLKQFTFAFGKETGLLAGNLPLQDFLAATTVPTTLKVSRLPDEIDAVPDSFLTGSWQHLRSEGVLNF